MFPDHTYVSSDDIRQTITGDVYDGSRNEEVWEIYYHDIQASLDSGKNVVADATNLTHRHRSRAMECLCQRDMIHAIVFKNIGQAVTRNAAREPGPGRHGTQRVPDATMMDMIKLYEESLQDILSEGYDTITYIEEWG